MNEDLKRARRKKENMILFLVGYIFLSLFFIRLGMILNSGYKLNASIVDTTMTSLKNKIWIVPQSKEDIKIFMLFSFIYSIFVINSLSKNEKFMTGREYGSARWGNRKDIKPFINKKEDENVILTNTEKISIDSEKIRRTSNVIVVGGSGTGKSRFYLKPNLMQMHSSYVITDPSGDILKDTGDMFSKNGYRIKVLDLYEMQDSYKYNPFQYIRKETDILKLINNFLNNTNDGDSKSSDPFWDKAETALYQSLFSFMWLYLKKEEQNFSTVLRLLELTDVSEEDENMMSEMDFIMEKYQLIDPNNFAYRNWLIFKKASGKTAKSILIGASVRLSPFNIKDIETLTSKDEMELDTIGDEKTALFILIPDGDSTFNFLVAILFEQLFNELYYKADFVYKGKLPYKVRCLIDEFANIGQIPKFEEKLATMRRRGIDASIIIQNLAQLESLYKKHWKSIIGNADSFLFLGGIDKDSHKYVSELLGKTTIDMKTTGKTLSKQNSTNTNMQKLGRELLTSEEVGQLDDNKCIYYLRGVSPFYSDKFKLEKHKRYKELYDGKGENIFSFKEYKKAEEKKSTVIKLQKEIKNLKHRQAMETLANMTLDEKNIEEIYKEEIANIKKYEKKITIEEETIEDLDLELKELELELLNLKKNDKTEIAKKLQEENQKEEEIKKLEEKVDSYENYENNLEDLSECLENALDSMMEDFDIQGFESF